jgi:hypothetical protein
MPNTKPHRLQFNFEDTKGERVGDWPVMPTLTEDTGWKEVSETVAIPDGAKVIALWPGFMEAAGTLDIDDVQVTPVAAPVYAAPALQEWPPGGKAFLWNGVMPAIPQNNVQVTLNVNGASPTAADSNDGSTAKPFKTIHAALQVALENKKKNIGTRVLIQPGLYRETILDEPGYGSPDNDTSAPLIIEAAVKGKVIVSGADRWNNWKARCNAGTVHAPLEVQVGRCKEPVGHNGRGGWRRRQATDSHHRDERCCAPRRSGVWRRQSTSSGTGGQRLKARHVLRGRSKEVLSVQFPPGSSRRIWKWRHATRFSEPPARRIW